MVDLNSNQELNHQFIDEPLSITVHSMGIFICISFSNIIQIYGYTIDGLYLFKQFNISNVRIVISNKFNKNESYSLILRLNIVIKDICWLLSMIILFNCIIIMIMIR